MMDKRLLERNLIEEESERWEKGGIRMGKNSIWEVEDKK